MRSTCGRALLEVAGGAVAMAVANAVAVGGAAVGGADVGADVGTADLVPVNEAGPEQLDRPTIASPSAANRTAVEARRLFTRKPLPASAQANSGRLAGTNGHRTAYQKAAANRAGWPGSYDQRPIQKDHAGGEAITMTRHPVEFRCDLCRRRVEDDLSARARRGWQPFIVCDTCLREAGSADSRRMPQMAATAN